MIKEALIPELGKHWKVNSEGEFYHRYPLNQRRPEAGYSDWRKVCNRLKRITLLLF